MEHILFLTGRLAQPSLERVLAAHRSSALHLGSARARPAGRGADDGRHDPAPGDGRVRSLAPLPGTDAPRRVDRIIVPGRCRGDVDALTRHFGIPVQRGPEEVKDLPLLLRSRRQADRARRIRQSRSLPRSSMRRASASTRSLRAPGSLRADGADVIDLGCLPDTTFGHLVESVQALKAEGFEVSVDSIDPDELLRGGRAGADYLLSLTLDTLWVADEVASTPILIPRTPARRGIAVPGASRPCSGRAGAFLADSILDPIPFGLAASIVRYHRLRERFPEAPIMMGVGNLTELTEADTSGINALLFGICAELDVAAVLTTQVSNHARRAVKEADWARRIMHAARHHDMLPKGIERCADDGACQAPVPDTPEEIAATAALVRDPNFRVQVSAQRPACLQPRRVARRAGCLRAVAAARARRRRRACVLHGRGAGACRDRAQARQALRAGPGAGLGLCGRSQRTGPRTPGVRRARRWRGARRREESESAE